MEIKELSRIIKDNGVVGAGGAGFPTYVKIDERANTIIMNCAECEPLLKLHRQLLQLYAKEILETFSLIADTVGAAEAIIGIKAEYKQAIEALHQYIELYPNVRLHLLQGVYPMGDEVILIYEATGKVIRPGGLPIEAGIAVFNVETVYNIYRGLQNGEPVVDKVVSVVGEVENPITVRVPLGCSIEEVVSTAGKLTTEHPVYMLGGPMMGKICSRYDTVTKTTNAILVLPENHLIVQKKNRTASIDMKRAASACCQCQMCTDLCPRHALGHPIEPHKFMRSAANKDFQDANVFINTLFCSSCGLCEMYACPQGLSPRTLMDEYKTGLRKAGVKIAKDSETTTIKESREYRKTPEERLTARLGLSRYDKPAPLYDNVVSVLKVKELLSQHIGLPAKALVKAGDMVYRGQVIGRETEGISVPVHASVSGRVTDVTERYIMIEAD